MKKMSKKQMVALYVLSAIILICLIGAIVMLAKESGNHDSASKNEATKTEVSEVSETTKENTSEQNVVVDNAPDLLAQLAPMLNCTSTTSLDEDKITHYYKLKSEDLSDCAGVIAGVELADEIVVLKAKDGNHDTLKAGAEYRLDSQKKTFQDYEPEQSKRLESAQIVTAGDYVLFVCADDADRIVAKFKELAGE